MHQKQVEEFGAKRTDASEANKPKTSSTEKMRKLRQRGKVEFLSVASQPLLASTSTEVIKSVTNDE